MSAKQNRHLYINILPFLILIYFSFCLNSLIFFVHSSFALSSFILCLGKRAVDCNKITNYMLKETRLFFLLQLSDVAVSRGKGLE